MACVIKPHLGPSGEYTKWELTTIPSNKPFVSIVTGASEPLSSSDDLNMNFVKTKSLVFSPFHSNARYINFEIGYSKDAKWLDHLANKWNEFANFFVSGFLEAIYSINEEGGSTITYIQVDAKLIDYDIRFRTSSSPHDPSILPKSPTSNAFAQRRAKVSSSSPTTPKSTVSRSTSVITHNTQKTTSNTSINQEDSTSDLCNELESTQLSTNQTLNKSESEPTTASTHKRKLTDLCNDVESDVPEPDNKKGGRGRGRSGGKGKRGRK